MDIVFEIARNDIATISEIKASVGCIKQEYITNGFDGVEIIAIVVALIPALKDLILQCLAKETVTIKISNEYGSVEISGNSKEAQKQLDAYLRFLEKPHEGNIS